MPRQFFAMLRVELLKVFSRFSGWATLLMAIFVPLVTLGFLHLINGSATTSTVQGHTSMGLNSFDLVSAMKWCMRSRNVLLLPLLLTLATALSVSGERSERTLRELLVRPVPRWSVLAAKQLALWALSATSIVVSLATTLAVGYWLFGGPAMDQSVADPDESLNRAILGFLLCFVSDVALIGLATALATFVSSVGGVVIALAFTLILDLFGYALLNLLAMVGNMSWAGTASHYTLVSLLTVWDHWMDEFNPVQFAEVFGFIALVWAIGIARFSRTDVP